METDNIVKPQSCEENVHGQRRDGILFHRVIELPASYRGTVRATFFELSLVDKGNQEARRA